MHHGIGLGVSGCAVVGVSMWDSAAEMLSADNKSLRDAGNDLAIAALHVAKEYDGVHRLMIAVAAWSKAVADEGGRGQRAPDLPSTPT